MKKFILINDQVRKHCANYIMTQAPEGYVVKVIEQLKKREQEEKYHAMIGDISKQCEHVGRTWDLDDWKRILVDEFAEEMRMVGAPLHHDSRITPSIDGKRIVQLGIQTRDFYVNEAAQFIEYLYSFGADRSVIWTNKRVKGKVL
jgi:hypothetical protein